jgi:2',3'-cyclic-nucleotide 2'-phosphodiesterase
VGTIDAKVFPKGTAHITDIGMVGPVESVIGDDIQAVIHRFLTVMPYRLAVGKGNKHIFNSVLINVDDKSGQALSIQRVDREVDI